MRLIPEQRNYYFEEIAKKRESSKKNLETNQDIISSEAYKASNYGNYTVVAGETSFYEAHLRDEQALAELSETVEDYELPTPNIDGKEVEIGSYVTCVDSSSYTDSTGNKVPMSEKVIEVLVIEGEIGIEARMESDIKFAPTDSALGQALLGAAEGNVVTFKTPNKRLGTDLVHSCTIQTVDNGFVYSRYEDEYRKENGPVL